MADLTPTHKLKDGAKRLAVVCACGDGYLVLVDYVGELEWKSVEELTIDWTPLPRVRRGGAPWLT